MDEVIREKPHSCTTSNTNEDVLTLLFGPDKPGRVLGTRKGVTKTKLSLLRQRDDKVAKLEQEQYMMQKQIAELLHIIKGSQQASEGQSHMATPSPNPSLKVYHNDA